MLKVLLSVLMSLVLFVPVFAADDVFTKIDADKNGKIDKKEFADTVSKSFDKLDKDLNGYLEWDEFKATGPGAKELFDELDADKDGKISREEFTKGSEKRFEVLDKDKNGYLDRNELNVQEMWRGSADRNTPAVGPFLWYHF